MDDRQLEDMLLRLKTPEPSKDAQKQALERALAAYDEKMSHAAQGSAAPHRLTGINNKLNLVRRWIMKKRYIVSGMTGAVATCALVAVLGTGFFETQIDNIAGPAARPQQTSGGGGGGAIAFRTMSNNEVTARSGFPCLFGCDKKEASAPKANAGALRLDNADALFAGAPQSSKSSMSSADARVVRQAPVTAEQEVAPSVKSGSPLPSEGFATVLKNAPSEQPQKEYGGKDKADLAKRAPMQDMAAGAMPQQNMVMPEGKTMERRVNEADMMIAPAPGVSVQPFPVAPPVDVIQHQYQDVGRDQFQAFEENSLKSVKTEPVSTFSIDVDTASYAFARRALNNGMLPQKNAIRIEEMINYFDYSYPVPEAGGHPFEPTVAVYDSPWRGGNKLIHIGVKGYEVQEKVASNLVFLIDTSGSMNSHDKLPLLVNSFKLLLDTLSPDDTIGIVTYAGSAGTVLAPTKVSNKTDILRALERLSAGGSTAGGEGIRQAYNVAQQAFIKGGNNRIILATDGDFNVGITNRDELKGFVERKRDEGISLSVLGFGQGNYNDHMMQALAQNGNGNAAYIDSLSEARKVLVDEASSTLFTIAKDVKIQVEFNPALVQEYRLVGYETRHLNREDFNNDKVDAGEIGAGHTVTAIYEVTPKGVVPMVDDLRYQTTDAKTEKKAIAESAPAAEGNGDEYAFLKIRYKKPDANTSILMTRPITKADETSFDALSDDIRFANAVAGFAQVLKGSKFVGTLSYDRIIEIANQARGKDEFGYRTEFVNLVRLAKSAAALQPQR